MDADADYDAVMNGDLTDGSIILMHDIHQPSVQAAIRFIPELVAKGYKLVPVSEMAEAKNVDLQYACYVDFWQSTFDRGEIPGYQGTVSTDGTSDSSDTSGDSSGDGSSDVSDGSGDGSGDGSDGSDVSDGSSDDGSYDDSSSYDDGSYDDSSYDDGSSDGSSYDDYVDECYDTDEEGGDWNY